MRGGHYAISGDNHNAGSDGSVRLRWSSTAICDILLLSPDLGIPVSETVIAHRGTFVAFDQLSQLEKGTPLFCLANRENTRVAMYTIEFEKSSLNGNDEVFTCRSNRGNLWGKGFSGSPAITPEGKTLGAYYLTHGDHTELICRSVESMIRTLSVRGDLDSNTRSRIPVHQGITWEVRGLKPDAIKYIRTYWHTGEIRPSGANPTRVAGEVYSPQPGATFGFQTLAGPVVTMTGYAALTYTKDDSTYLACGHEIGGGGESSVPVIGAVVDRLDLAAGGDKLCHTVGGVIGTVTLDLSTGVVVKFGEAPETTPVTVILHAGGKSQSWTHYAARNGGSDLEVNAVRTGLSAVLLNADDLMGSFTAQGSVTLEIDGIAKPVTAAVTVAQPVHSVRSLGEAVDARVGEILQQARISGKAFTKATLTLSVSNHV